MLKGMLDQNYIRNFFISIGFPIRPLSKLYEDDLKTIKMFLVYRITPYARPLNVLITDLRSFHLCKTFYMVDTRLKMQLAGLDSNTCGRKSLVYIIDCGIGVRFYHLPGSEHYKLIHINRFCVFTHHQTLFHDKHSKKY